MNESYLKFLKEFAELEKKVHKSMEEIAQKVMKEINNKTINDSTIKELSVIELTNKKIKDLPEWFSELKNLNILELRDNEITKIPITIMKLIKLQNLDLNNNQLTSIPEKIEQLKELKELKLNNNQLTSIPSSLCELIKKGTGVYLDGNQLKEITILEKKYIVLNDEYIYSDNLKGVIKKDLVKNINELDANTLTQLIKEYKIIEIKIEPETAYKILYKITGNDYTKKTIANIYQENPENEELINKIIDLCPKLRTIIPFKEQSMIQNKKNLLDRLLKKDNYPIIL